MPIELTAYELELLKVALTYAQKLEDAGETLTRDGLRRELSCGKDIASRLQHFIKEQKALKVAEHRKALPENAETRAVVDYAIGSQPGTAYSYILRENVRLQRALDKAKFVTDAEKEQRTQAVRAEIEELKALAKEELGIKPRKTEKSAPDSGLMLEINVADHHFGKLAWPVETGSAPYDLKIAEAMFVRAVDKLLERAKGYNLERILFVLGNDFLHANSVDGSTFNGTKLDTEGRFQKTYWVARKAVCSAIERMREIAPVKVEVIYGNHDRTSMWTLADSVECYFHGDTRVEVDNRPIYRKYEQWGTCGLMFTHGDLGRRNDFPLLFATECPEIFGNTTCREVHTGHLHTTKTEEFHGVRVRILPSLTPADAWHSENGYLGNLRNAEAYLWSRTEGMIAQFIYSDNAFPALKTEKRLV
jgi:hypothetical protein